MAANGRPVQPSGDVRASLQKSLDALSNGLPALTLPGQVRLPLRTAHRQYLFIDFSDPTKFFGRHRIALR